MAKSLSDEQVQARIEELEQEERKLRTRRGRSRRGRRRRSAGHAQRLEAIRIELDRSCRDYLRQRRALRDAGQDPDNARMRDPGTVERYWG